MKIHSHITFNGNCREAMTFYQENLGGELYVQTVGDTSNTKKLPAKMKKTILYAQLHSREFVMSGSDMVEENGLMKGNVVSLVLNCKNEKEIRDCYRKLSKGGRETHPLELNVWGALSGTLIDKFGISWFLVFNQKKIN